MSTEDYFGEWLKVIDRKELDNITKFLKSINPNTICPKLSNVFKAFKVCPYNKLKVVMIGQDPYPDLFLGKPRATGILFGNDKDIPNDKLSPSLEIIKESAINFEIPHNIIIFDQTLENWASQGVLMINSALTCEVNRIGSHVNHWRPFISSLIKNLSYKESGLIYILFGKQAQTLKPYIDSKYNDIIEIEHPAYFARTNTSMPSDVFFKMNDLLFKKYGETITLFNNL